MILRSARVLLVSAFRRRAALPVLLAVLPPTLLTLALAASVGAVGLVSEELAGRLPGGTIVLSGAPTGGCSRVGYGLATLVYGGGLSATIPVVYALDPGELSGLLGVDLLGEAGGCPAPALLLPRGFAADVPQYARVEVVAGGVCIEACAVRARLDAIGVPVLVGWRHGYTDEVFLCRADPSEVVRKVAGSVVGDVSQFASRYSLLVALVYVPALYLATLKVLDEVRAEAYVLSGLGVDRGRLAAAFASFCSIAVAAASLYSLSLGYTVVLLGRVVLAHLGAAVIPPPALEPRHLLVPAALSLLEVPLSYVALMRGYRRVLR